MQAPWGVVLFLAGSTCAQTAVRFETAVFLKNKNKEWFYKNSIIFRNMREAIGGRPSGYRIMDKAGMTAAGPRCSFGTKDCNGQPGFLGPPKQKAVLHNATCKQPESCVHSIVLKKCSLQERMTKFVGSSLSSVFLQSAGKLHFATPQMCHHVLGISPHSRIVRPSEKGSISATMWKSDATYRTGMSRILTGQLSKNPRWREIYSANDTVTAELVEMIAHQLDGFSLSLVNDDFRASARRANASLPQARGTSTALVAVAPVVATDDGTIKIEGGHVDPTLARAGEHLLAIDAPATARLRGRSSSADREPVGEASIRQRRRIEDLGNDRKKLQAMLTKADERILDLEERLHEANSKHSALRAQLQLVPAQGMPNEPAAGGGRRPLHAVSSVTVTELEDCEIDKAHKKNLESEIKRRLPKFQVGATYDVAHPDLVAFKIRRESADTGTVLKVWCDESLSEPRIMEMEVASYRVRA
jgi:hypothetical protein